jgi:hypothetical protein
MFQKTLESLKSLKNAALNRDTLVTELRERTADLAKLTVAEREKILDTLVTQLLKGEDLGDHESSIRAKVKSRLFEKAEGDKLFLSNLKYINEVLTGSLPRSLADLAGFRSTLAHKLVEDARGGAVPSGRPQHRRDGGHGGRRHDHRRGRSDRPQQGAQRHGQNGQGQQQQNQAQSEAPRPSDNPSTTASPAE